MYSDLLDDGQFGKNVNISVTYLLSNVKHFTFHLLIRMKKSILYYCVAVVFSFAVGSSAAEFVECKNLQANWNMFLVVAPKKSWSVLKGVCLHVV